MSETSPNLSLPYIQPSQAQKHVTHNEAIWLLDALVQSAVLDRDRTEPPLAPAAGARHLVAEAATGAWAGQAGRLAVWDGEGAVWRFLDPVPGWQCFVLAEGVGLVFTAAGWQVLASLAGREAPIDRLGIGAAADDTNRLAVAAPAVLLTHMGRGHQLKVNKAGPPDTASLLFQSDWAGRAEMGLVGSDDFSVKVSSDGAAFRTVLSADRATGRVALPCGLDVGGTVAGSAVQAGPADATAGRLLAVGAFGLGGSAPLVGDAAVTDGSIAPGFHAYDAALGSSGGPAGVQSGILLHQRRGPGAEIQLLVAEAGSSGGVAGITFSRARSGGGWTGWLAGGVVESGTNANGRFLRQQDGTLTCWQSVTTATSGDKAVTFPCPFVSTAGLVTTTGVVATTSVSIAARITQRTATGCSVSAFSSASTPARLAVTVDLISMGRWY